MRNMDYIGISQSIGRVIRLGGAEKTFGLVCVPVFDKVGISTARSVQAVVDTVFEQGQTVPCLWSAGRTGTRLASAGSFCYNTKVIKGHSQ